MPLLTSLTALLAVVGPVLATAPLSDGQSTEVIGAQEVGSTTVDGTMVYSMNYCTIVYNTHCHTSLSTGGPAPYHTGGSGVPGYSSSSPPAPTYGQPGTASSGSSVPIPTPSTVSSGGTVGNPPATITVASSESVPGGEYTSTTGEGSSTSTQTPDVPTGAAVMGASVMGNIFVAALAALVV
ncbi:hypothetical protein NLG97_g4909 [Lecanicillium saksenae]|uniref:Uncharacterized protein n=1 Tax=Lecanicillium saksenae TaxID=468837 RepID=A0ACC1QTZ9_9HYPO|nr:hypothetical protein NLG97_g4909 [Lecanicillium saksenae]